MTRHSRIDVPLMIIGLLFIGSLAAFVAGVFPYPYGWIILAVIFVGRWLSLKGRR